MWNYYLTSGLTSSLASGLTSNLASGLLRFRARTYNYVIVFLFINTSLFLITVSKLIDYIFRKKKKKKKEGGGT